jgi:TPP-dependent pyruvate/acetoin dehydrogenase alpha subunit
VTSTRPSPDADQEVVRRPLTDEEVLRVYRLMATARVLEIQVAQAYAEGKLPGWIHSCEGHEALGAAVALCLRPTDHLVPHYRSRPQQLGKGMAVREVLAEVFGTAHAASKGRGGETHVSSLPLRIYGMTGVLGSNIPLSTGVAYASKMRGTDEVTLCTFGDGTANRGAFHEALNLAAIWDLPVVFVCENNLYAEMSKSSDFVRVDNIADRAAGYGMPGRVVDGHDPQAVIEVLAHAVECARRGQPSLIEAKVIRRRGHWEGDPQDYRTKEELSGLDLLDPVPTYRNRLRDELGVNEHDLAAIDEAARAEVDEALSWAVASPLPTAEDVTTGVYERDFDA